MKRALGIALAALLAVGRVAGGEEVPSRPFLRIETGMHTAAITRIDADAAGRFLVTGSFDKTVRVWDLANGQLLRILRPPIGDGNEGQIHAVAISPDGELVAVGGLTGYQWDKNVSVYLFDRRSGRLLRRLSGLPGGVFDLAFSPDGTRLAATLGGANGLRFFRIADGREVGRDTDYGDHSFSADFAPDGRLVTASFDGKIRLYGHDLRLFRSSPAPGGRKPFGVAFSPDGRTIAIGYYDARQVDVLDAASLQKLYSPKTRETNDDLSSVAWSSDGTVLYAAGRANDDWGRCPIRRWLNAGRGEYLDLEGPVNTVTDLKALPEGRLAFGTGEPAWGVLDASGKAVLSQHPFVGDFRETIFSFRLNPDGATIQFAYKPPGKRLARFGTLERRLVLDPPQDPSMATPLISVPGLEVTGWHNTTNVQLNGRRLELKGSIAQSLALEPGGRSFVLGTQAYLHSFRGDGSQRWAVLAPGPACAVNLTRDGRLAVAAFGDGTIRWYRADNGKEFLAFFPHTDGKRWILWTPSGYYDASVGGEDLIGWHVNNGPDREADLFPVSLFRNRFRRPEVIDFILKTLARRSRSRAPSGHPDRSAEAGGNSAGRTAALGDHPRSSGRG